MRLNPAGKVPVLKLDGRTIIFDDGGSLDLTWNDGVRATRTRIDGTDDSFEWVRRDTIYDSNGKTAQVMQLQDDSDLIVTSHAGGKLLDRTTYDNSGDEIWHVERISYDARGDVVDTVHYDDSGNILIF